MKIFLIGFMGTGKSYWGRQLSEKLGMRFFDLDEEVCNHAGKSIRKIFEDEGEEQFRLQEKEVLHIITESHDSFILACGGGTPCYFNNIDYLKESGITVWFNTQQDVLFKRLLAEKEIRPLIHNLTDEQLLAFIARKMADRRIYYEQADIHIEGEPVQLDQLIEIIFHA